MHPDTEGNIAVVKLMRTQMPGSPRHRHCERYFREEFPTNQESMNQAFRLVHLADKGDADARALVDPIAPDWEFGAWLNEEKEKICPRCAVRSAKVRSKSTA